MEASGGSKRRGVAGAILAALTALTLGLPSIADDAFLPLSSVRPGMKGYGLSVFAGRAIERFEVEVLGVVPKAAPDRAQILVRVSGMGLEESGVVAGMSGSPVYLEGRLAGAVASGWGFAKSPIAGVTPIESMTRIESAVAVPRSAAAAARPLSTDFARRSGEEDETLLGRLRAAFEERLPPPPASGGSGLLAPLVAGLAGPVDGPFPGLLPRLGLSLPVTGPSAQAAPPPDPGESGGGLVPGSSIVALLVDGDLQLGATGTVTYVYPDGRFLAFGHPLLNLGELELPVAQAPILVTLPNLFQSFKIGYPARPDYRLVRDRDSGVSGRSEPARGMVPLALSYSGEDGVRRSFSFRIAAHPRLLPALLVMAGDAGLSAADPTPRERTMRFRVAVRTAAGEIAYADEVSGTRARETALMTAAVLAATIAENEFQDPGVSGIELSVESLPGERRLRLLDASLTRRRLAPGDAAVALVRLATRRGEETTRLVRLAVPADAPEGRATLVIADGSVASSLRQSLSPEEPRSLSDLKRFIERLVPTDRLYAALLVPSKPRSTGSRSLTALPPSFAALLAAGRVQGEDGGAGDARVLAETSEPLESPFSGAVRLELEIRRPRS